MNALQTDWRTDRRSDGLTQGQTTIKSASQMDVTLAAIIDFVLLARQVIIQLLQAVEVCFVLPLLDLKLQSNTLGSIDPRSENVTSGGVYIPGSYAHVPGDTEDISGLWCCVRAMSFGQ